MRTSSINEHQLAKAKAVAKATEWSGDIRVNFLTAHNAASVLLRRVEELEKELAESKPSWDGYR